MIDGDIYEVYPSTVGADVDEFLDNFKCEVTLSLPSNESTEKDEIIQKAVTTNVTLDEPEEIALSGVINNNVHARYEKQLIENRAFEKQMIIIASCASVLLIGLIVFMSIRVRRRKKNSDYKSMRDKDNMPNN